MLVLPLNECANAFENIADLWYDVTSDGESNDGWRFAVDLVRAVRDLGANEERHEALLEIMEVLKQRFVVRKLLEEMELIVTKIGVTIEIWSILVVINELGLHL